MGKSYKGVNRFFLPETTFQLAQKISIKDLDENLRKHLKALRMDPQEELELLNGKGEVARAVLKERATLEIIQLKKIFRLPTKIELYLSPPRGDDFSVAISQATEMGVEKIVFLRTQHNQYPKGAEPWIRGRRISEAALEQCGLPWKVEIEPVWSTLEESLKKVKNAVFCDESSVENSNKIGWLNSNSPKNLESIALFIGPEGGWSEEERSVLKRQCCGLSLGPYILKVPTAIVAAITFLRVKQ